MQTIVVGNGDQIYIEQVNELGEVTTLSDDDIIVVGVGIYAKQIKVSDFLTPLKALVNSQLIGTLETETQDPPTTRPDGSALQVMDGISYSLPDGTTWTTSFLDANGNAIVLTGPVSGVIRFVSAGVWTDQPAQDKPLIATKANAPTQQNVAGIDASAFPTILTNDQVDEVNGVASNERATAIEQNIKLTPEDYTAFTINGAFNASNEFVDTNNWRRTDYILLTAGQTIKVKSITNDLTIAPINVFTSAYVYSSKVFLTETETVQEVSFTATAKCYVELQYRYTSQANAGSYTITDGKIYVASGDINNENSTTGVPDLATIKKILYNVDFNSPFVSSKNYDYILKNSSISPTTGAITTDSTKDLYVISGKAGQTVNYSTFTNAGFNVYVVLNSAGQIIASASNTGSTSTATGSYAATVDFKMFVAYIHADGDAAQVSVSITDTTVLANVKKVEQAAFNNVINGASPTVNNAVALYSTITGKAMTASSTDATNYGAATTSNIKDVILKLVGLKSGQTYQLNWAIADPFAVYTPFASGFHKATVTVDNTANTTTFTLAAESTDALLTSSGVLIQVSTSANVVNYEDRDTYTVTGYGTSVKPTTQIAEKALGYTAIKSTSLNLYSYGGWLAKDGTVNYSTILQNAVNYINQNGGGTLYVPKGMYIANGVIIPSNVTILGEDMSNVIFLATTGAIFETIGTLDFRPEMETRNVHLRNFTMDGSRVPGTTYDVSKKGCYMLYTRDCTYQNLVVQNTIATGFGNDFFNNSKLHNITARNCGRLSTSDQDPGASGVGIGTGDYDLSNPHSEHSSMSQISAYDCGQYGVFLEQQNSQYDTVGYMLSDIYAEGCRKGLGFSGASDVTVNGAVLFKNIEAGVTVDSGSFQSSTATQRVTRRLKLVGVNSVYNGVADIDPTSVGYLSGNGFAIKGFQNTYGVELIGCSTGYNKADGIILYNETDDNAHNFINKVSVIGGQHQFNGRHGLFLKNGTMNNINIQQAMFMDNVKKGIYLGANLNQSMIANNIITNNGDTGFEKSTSRTLTNCVVTPNLVNGNASGDIVGM